VGKDWHLSSFTKVSFKRRIDLRAEIARSDADLIEPIIEQLRYARSAYPYYYGRRFDGRVNDIHDAVVRAIMNVYFPSKAGDHVTWEDLIDTSVFRYPGSPTAKRSEPWRLAHKRTHIEEVIRLNSDNHPPPKYSKKEEELRPEDYGF